ncbi:ABC transporter permease [Limimaricola cinnabarinus]|uniref:ABC-type nitrate/sulfonate/bicarbonate transport system, permease component n=1 Tax=Limimaricola cinnabarinus LL-001 TaxID=1337093 RepID=U2Z9B4_9RHOB|nr:ABC transporter permease [Limimaricola cinnabarinus]GAD57657.1 ABC-type nitrate/sulfonate/bicarbonate transport system, permease component [Limimaricola cinnabarinus LL-001]
MSAVAPRGMRRTAFGAAGLVAFIALWKAAGSFGWTTPGTMPDPFLVPAAIRDEIASGRLLPAVGSSLVHYIWGLALGSVLGIAVGLATATLPRLDAAHAWLARILRPIPPLAWVVFAIAWFKVSHAGAAFVISIGVFWVNYFATYAAVRNVDPRYHELARAFGQGAYFKRHRTVTLPAASPGILSGLRTGVGQAWMTLIAAELLGVPGMGQEMNAAAGVGAYEAVVVYMLAISVVYTLSDALFSLIEGRLLAWRPS